MSKGLPFDFLAILKILEVGYSIFLFFKKLKSQNAPENKTTILVVLFRLQLIFSKRKKTRKRQSISNQLIQIIIISYSIIMILKIIESPLLGKRFRVFLKDGKVFDFGLDKGKTYIDHHDTKLRDAYRARHLGNKTEYDLIKSNTPSPAFFSYHLLWGEHKKLIDNIHDANKLLK